MRASAWDSAWLTALFGALGMGSFYVLMYWALVWVSAGVATVVLAVVPLMTLVLAALQGLERLHVRGGVGAMLACAGIVWMVSGRSRSDFPSAPSSPCCWTPG